MGGFFPLVELHQEGSSPATCAAGLFVNSPLMGWPNHSFDCDSLYRFFMAQITNPTHTDCVSQVLQELEEIHITLEIDEIVVIKKYK